MVDSADSTKVYNNTILNGKGKDGCGIRFKKVFNLELKDIYIDNCKSENRGAIKIIDKGDNITISNITIVNSEAK